MNFKKWSNITNLRERTMHTIKPERVEGKTETGTNARGKTTTNQSLLKKPKTWV